MARRCSFKPKAADHYPLLVIQNAEVLGLFGWQQSDRKISASPNSSHSSEQIDEQGAQSEKLESVQRSAYQNAILNLRNALMLYQRLKNSLQPEGKENFAAELEAFESSIPAAGKAASQREEGEDFDKTKLDDVAELIQRYAKAVEMAYILTVPPQRAGSATPAAANSQWHSVGDSLLRRSRHRRNSSHCKGVRD